MSLLLTKSYGKLATGIHNNIPKGFKRFLIDKGYGIPASEENIEMYKKNQAMYEQENEILNNNKKELCTLIEDKFINIISPVNPTGNLYGKITPQKIIDQLKEQLVKDEKYNQLMISKYIIISDKIIQQGIFTIFLKFSKDCQCKFNIIIGQNENVLKEMYLNHINEEKNPNNNDFFSQFQKRDQRKPSVQVQMFKEEKKNEEKVEDIVQDNNVEVTE